MRWGRPVPGRLWPIGAVLQVDNAGTVAEPLTINGHGQSWNGALRNVGGTNTWTGPITLGSGSRIGSTSGVLNVNGGVDGSAGNQWFTSSAGGGSIVYNSAINLGSGWLLVHGWGGSTTLNVPATVGTTTAVEWSGSLLLGVDNALPAHTILKLGIQAAGPPVVDYQGSLDLQGHNLTIAGLYAQGDLVNDVVTSSSGTPTLTVNNGSDYTFAGRLTGSLGLVKRGGALFTLSGANTYTGVTDVQQGMLLITNPTSLGDAGSGDDGAERRDAAAGKRRCGRRGSDPVRRTVELGRRQRLERDGNPRHGQRHLRLVGYLDDRRQGHRQRRPDVHLHLDAHPDQPGERLCGTDEGVRERPEAGRGPASSRTPPAWSWTPVWMPTRAAPP